MTLITSEKGLPSLPAVKRRTSIATVSKQNIQEPSGWSYTEWEQAGESSPQFTGFRLYIIECISSTERFIKVGKTFTEVGLRFRTLPYKFKVITVVYHNAYAIQTLESKIHKQIKKHSYAPKKEFQGSTECYTLDAITLAVALAEQGYEDESRQE